jgi:hypothetical protein
MQKIREKNFPLLCRAGQLLISSLLKNDEKILMMMNII